MKIKNKTNLILIATIISSLFNIAGDIISIKLGFNETGIYIATIIATFINAILLFKFSKYKYRKINKQYIKDIVNHANDLILNKTIQKIAYISLVSISSSFGTETYVIACICSNVVQVLLQLADGYYTGLLVSYANSIKSKEHHLQEK